MKAKILALLMLVLLDPLVLLAQADRHDVRQGNRRFGREDWKEAELSYRKALVKDSLSAAARYNLASALYRQENYEGAREMMGSFEGQENLSSDIYYNSGDVALQLKDYAAAVEAFKQSLLLNPGDLDAKENYIYAKKMLENQQNQQQGGGGGQNDQNDQDDQNNQDGQNDQNDQDGQNDQNDQNNQDDSQDGDDGQEPPQNQPDESRISPRQAEQMLNAMQAREQQTRDKVDREKAAALKSRQKEKNW
ncbi:MAG: tetratricopeptide repeat protein [Bacteroidetes bacterium]|uniref:Tetratricopeptide repeat protein n=1 Tax=Candidatus Cryptobacteroides avistercoris TaxID=2840758 RepID=A0A9D9NPM8_9BACT|nr:tetratricopeptide repeat protein [Candidatus Cryptobacteroides avistercoris]